MARPGRPRKQPIAYNEVPSEPVTPEVPSAPVVESFEEVDNAAAPSVTTIAEQDCWRYHPEIEPRKFRKGEVIPEGWTLDAAVRRLWVCDAYGQWSKV